MYFVSALIVIATTLSALQISGAPASGQAAPPAGNAENGKKIFAAYGCYQCHNYAAHGGEAGPRLAPRPIPFEAFARYVRKPTRNMPPYTAKVVSDKELADIYAFLLTIPPPPAADSIPILKR
ncbi:MAG TPA: cytochrome c [Vicinamibacterales bacterium]|nr:cytochrome c [Vicinamibacterales bacterium]